MLDHRYSKRVAQEGGMNTGRTWTKDGKRRQAGMLWGCAGFPPPLQTEVTGLPAESREKDIHPLPIHMHSHLHEL